METSIQVKHLLYLSVLSLNILSQVFSLQVYVITRHFWIIYVTCLRSIWDANVCYSELLHFNLNALPIILIVGFGIVTGFMISSRLIQYCLHQHPTMTFALIIGFVIGSLYAVFLIPERLNPMDHIIFPIDHWLLSKLCSW